MKYMILFSIMALTYFNVFASDFNPPTAKMEAVKENIHGYQFTNFYRWLEDKTNPETIEWSKAQHNYTVNYLRNNTKTIPGLRDEIEAHLDRDQRGAPFYKGKREFFYIKKKGDAQSKLYTIIDKKEIMIFDPLKFDESGKSAITGIAMTRDGNKAAIGMQFQGNEISTYRRIDTKSGKILGEPITNLSSFNWTFDEKHAYITLRSKEIGRAHV